VNDATFHQSFVSVVQIEVSTLHVLSTLNQTMNPLQKILLVEDDQDDQEFFVAALDGIENVSLSDVVNNGKEAIECLYKSAILPNIIFMDVNMPIMGGIECLGFIMNEPLMSQVPVIMLSSDIGQRERARQIGANGFIKKGISVAALREELQHSLFKFNYAAHNKKNK
jgi:CheY-like chemotaxis protein